MRALLTGGIKAILAIAALSTAAHWALRVQRDAPSSAPALAGLPDPATTGSIEPRRIERAPAQKPADLKAPEKAAAASLDQVHLAALIASAAPPKPKAAKTVAAVKTPAAKAPAAVKAASGGEKAAAKR